MVTHITAYARLRHSVGQAEEVHPPAQQALAVAQHDFDVQCLAYDRYAFSCMLEPEIKELGLAIEIDDWLEGLRG